MTVKRRGHGEGSIYQRKDGRWVASISLEHRKRKYFYGDTRKEVQEKLKVGLREQQQGTLVTAPQQMLKGFLEQWLEEVHKPGVRISTYARYRGLLNNHLIPALGNIQLQSLTPQQVQSFYADKLKEGLKPKTIKLIHTVLHKAIDNAVRWNLVSRNVCDLVSLPTSDRYEMQPLTLEQCQKLLTVARGHRLENMLAVAIATGMRRGELLALRWQDVSIEQGRFHVRRTVDYIAAYGRRGYVENEPKTASGVRQIELPRFAIDALVQQRRYVEQLKEKCGAKWRECDLVFCNNTGEYLYPVLVHKEFKLLLKAADLPAIRFHDLRHTAATILLSMDVHSKVVQELLGHSSITVTMDLYSHVLPSMQHEAMGKFDSVFRQQP